MCFRMELADWSRLRHAPSTQTAVRGLVGSETAAVSRSEVSCGSGIEFTAYAYRTNGKRQGVNTLCHRVIQGLQYG